eukprot:TRINITY_DN12666_c0_g2_i1.p1 TRINITY_DN12666_c0_g2~~TRINITY_DN12666_c0_g2_i1.p1  ORF type:complete len:223 (-),score=5.70 TRINITY_DN12666_c0_g2_i1:11-679(-)
MICGTPAQQHVPPHSTRPCALSRQAVLSESPDQRSGSRSTSACLKSSAHHRVPTIRYIDPENPSHQMYGGCSPKAKGSTTTVRATARETSRSHAQRRASSALECAPQHAASAQRCRARTASDAQRAMQQTACLLAVGCCACTRRGLYARVPVLCRLSVLPHDLRVGPSTAATAHAMMLVHRRHATVCVKRSPRGAACSVACSRASQYRPHVPVPTRARVPPC